MCGGERMQNYDDLTVEKLHDGIEIVISAEHRFGTDAFLLADFAAPRHKDTVCDLCTGSGIIALLMYQNFKPKHIFAVEIQEKAHYQLIQSLERSDISDITPILGDLKDYTSDKPLDLITCNPPYNISGTGAKNETEAVSIARHEMLCTIDDVCTCAKKNLRFGGRLCICNRPERLCDIMVSMRKHGIEPKRLRTVHKNPDCPPWLVLVEGRFGGNSFMQIEKPLYVRTKDGAVSDEVQNIYNPAVNK